MKRIVAIFGILISLNAFSQVLNIEQQRIITDTTGWAGTSQISTSYTKTVNSLLTVNWKNHVQFKTDSSLYLMFIDYGLAKSRSSDFDNAGTVHFRYNRKINKYFTLEAFTQGQFNKLLNVRFRWLTGIGPRFKVVGKKNFRVYFASLYMYEYEEVESPLLFHRDHRISSYVSITCKHKSGTILTNTLYYQPLATRIGDYRVYNQFDLNFRITKSLSFTTSWKYFYDSNPPEGVVHATHYLGNGLTFKF